MTTAEETATTSMPLTITRIFDAPRELVFKAFTEPEHFTQWWGPNNFTTPHCTIDLRVGGKMHYCMRSPDGNEFWGIGVFQEIVEPERLVYNDSFSDAEGNVVPASDYGMGDWPLETQVVMTFEEEGEKTRFTMQSFGMPEGKGRDGAEIGWGQSFDRLAAYVSSLSKA